MSSKMKIYIVNFVPELLDEMSPYDAIVLSHIYGFIRYLKRTSEKNSFKMTQEELATNLHMHRRTLQRSLNFLSENNYIEIEKVKDVFSISKINKYRVTEKGSFIIEKNLAELEKNKENSMSIDCQYDVNEMSISATYATDCRNISDKLSHQERQIVAIYNNNQDNKRLSNNLDNNIILKRKEIEKKKDENDEVSVEEKNNYDKKIENIFGYTSLRGELYSLKDSEDGFPIPGYGYSIGAKLYWKLDAISEEAKNYCYNHYLETFKENEKYRIKSLFENNKTDCYLVYNNYFRSNNIFTEADLITFINDNPKTFHYSSLLLNNEEVKYDMQNLANKLKIDITEFEKLDKNFNYWNENLIKDVCYYNMLCHKDKQGKGFFLDGRVKENNSTLMKLILLQSVKSFYGQFFSGTIRVVSSKFFVDNVFKYNNYHNNQNKKEENFYLEEVKKAPIVVFENLQALHINPTSFPLFEEVINYRYKHKKITHFTCSNSIVRYEAFLKEKLLEDEVSLEHDRINSVFSKINKMCISRRVINDWQEFAQFNKCEQYRSSKLEEDFVNA